MLVVHYVKRRILLTRPQTRPFGVPIGLAFVFLLQ